MRTLKRCHVIPGVLMAALIAAVTASSSSAKPPAREVTKEYTGALALLVGTSNTPAAYVGDCDPYESEACVRFRLRPKDRFIRLRIQDATGLPIYAAVFAPDGSQVGEACGESEPIPSPGMFVDVWPTVGQCYEGVQPSLPTQGTITAVITRSR